MGKRDELWGVDLELCLLSGTGPRASCVLGMCSTAELHPQLSFSFHFETGSH